MGDITISEALREAFRAKKIEFLGLHEATPEEFRDALSKAKLINDHGAFVTLHELEDYEGMPHLLLTSDGTAGIAITKDGNIVSLFNGGKRHGVVKTLIPVAIEKGWIKLDNYNSDNLSLTYQNYGFNPVSKTAFDEKYAPDDWNFERDGAPNIVFWIHNGDSAEDVVYNFGKYDVPWSEVKEFLTYEEAGKYRDDLILEIERLENETSEHRDDAEKR